MRTERTPVRLRRALTKSNNVDWFPRIAPDGSKVLFNRSKGGWVPENDANYPEKWDLWTIGIDGTNETKLVENATWGTWRPDGKSIVFSRAGKVFTMDLASKTETLVLDGEKAFNKAGVILQEPNMSPDGKHLAITLRGSMRETGVWDLTKNAWTKSGDGCQIDWKRRNGCPERNLVVYRERRQAGGKSRLLRDSEECEIDGLAGSPQSRILPAYFAGWQVAGVGCNRQGSRPRFV